MDELPPDQPTASADEWRRALEKVVPCCVVLKVTQTRAFDTEPASSSYATGFIVDKSRGIICTNRHVVTPGPIVAEAIFLNREELPVHPVYYDPVHDFGFLRFDPSKLQFMQVQEVPLAPEAAAVGLEIRVVGNDSGEKVSILAGTIARLDRDAPHYGRKGYNDFNTFYLQAASGTKGGSSGSPVIDSKGRAIGLNAGGKNKAQSAYYLPLERVVRALALLQQHWPLGGQLSSGWSAACISRGDLQSTFVFKGFDEVRRLGLRQDTEAVVRLAKARSHGAPDAGGAQLHTVGLLVVEATVPGSPADGVLEPGDVLVRVQGQVVSHFLMLEELLDAAVGQTIELQLERGGKPLTVQLPVTDLHSVTPNAMLELAGGSVHALSYQQARNNRAVVGQVYVAEPGYMLGRAAIPKYALLTSLDGVPTPDLASFAAVLRGLQHGARVPLEYITFGERHRRKSAILQVDRQWYGVPLYWVRDDAAGAWHPSKNWPPLPPGVTDPAAARLLLPKAAGHSAQQQQQVKANGSSGGSEDQQVPEAAAAAAGGADDALQEAASAGAAANGTHPLHPIVAATRARLAAAKHSNGNSAAAAVVAAPAAGISRPEGSGGAVVAAAAAAAAAAGEVLREDVEEALKNCLVLVDVDIPLVALSDGVHARSFAGNGLVVYHGEHLGLVLVDRNTITIGTCDVNLCFGAHPAEIPAIVRFLHPLHNFALVAYSPAALPAEARSKIRAAQLLTSPPLARGERCMLVGLTKSLRIMQRRSTVTNATVALTIPSAEVPRFRAVHEEVVKLDQDFGATFSGVLTDDEGRIRALWGSYAEQVDREEREWCAGLPTHVFAPWVQRLVAQDATRISAPPLPVRVMDAELEAVLLSKAAQLGLPAEWVSLLDELDPERRQALRVRSTVANSHAAQVLRSGDMILAVNGQPVSSFTDVESVIAAAAGEQQAAAAAAAGTGSVAAAAAAAVDSTADAAAAAARPAKRPRSSNSSIADGQQDVHQQQQQPSVTLTLFRSGCVMDCQVGLGQEDSLGTDRLVHWCGAQLQAPHRSVKELGFQPEGKAGVFISRWHHGSPSHRYGLFALHWILEVNGQPTPDLDSFLKVVAPLRDGDFARVKVCHLETTQHKVLTLKLDTKYWPSWELRRDPGKCTWTRHLIGSNSSSSNSSAGHTAAAGSAAAAAAAAAAGGGSVLGAGVGVGGVGTAAAGEGCGTATAAACPEPMAE
uniref:Pro-apoptotic serine protease NMA111 n=1 Tax=Tetradesmus obliquus TaxID=3088 RepID=A0A383V519_TETOB|eukprot:jgi/Sobl393_1/14326/SZX60191.1